MIRKISKLSLILTYCLVAHNQIWHNLDFDGQISTIIKVAVILAFFETILKPIIKLLLLPINLITLGGIRLVINTFGLYLASFVLGPFAVQNISTDGTIWLCLNIPPFQFSGFFTYLVSSFTINLLLSASSLILYKKRKAWKTFYPLSR